MTEALEQTAQRIADHGRDALVARLRPAFEQAAAAHADVLELDPDELEQMVQRAADRADGLQWRRALASLASHELGIGLGEALTHPVVAQAQALLGAPSYEDTMAQLRSVQAGVAQVPAPDDNEAVANEEQLDRDSEDGRGEREPGDERDRRDPEDRCEPPLTGEGDSHDDVGAPLTEPASLDEAGPSLAGAETLAEAQTLRLQAIHVAGIANLAAAEAGVELRLADVGLDIVRGREESLGRLIWAEVHSLSVTRLRGRRRRRASSAGLVIRTTHGDATFEIPGQSPEQLRDQLAPWSARAGR